MSTLALGPTRTRRKKDAASYLLPDRDAEDQEFEDHFKRRCRPDSNHRLERMRDWQIARAMILSKHWLELNTAEKPSARAFRYTTPNPKVKFPRPVTNEIYPIYDNEVAKQARRKSTAYVRPVAIQEGTGGATGATVANDILEWHLESIGWSRKRKQVCRKEVGYGTAYLWSYLDQSYMHTIKVGVTEARRCVTCDFMSASMDLPPVAEMEGMGFTNYADPRYAKRTTTFDEESAQPVHDYTLRTCLACGSPLEQFTPGEEDDELDAFNRPLRDDVPLNQPNVEVGGPWEFFHENDGMGLEEPSDVMEIYRVVPRRLDTYMAAHYPDVWEDMEPDSARTIAEYFPFLGEYDFGNEGIAGDDDNRFQNHVLEFTAVIKPKPGEEMGRVVVFAGGIRALDTDLMLNSTHDRSVLIPRIHCTFARFFVRDSEIDGQGIVTPLVSPQNRINMTYAQVIDVRQRNGVNGIVATDGMQFTSGWLEGHNGRFIRYKPDPLHPNLKPEFIETRTIDQGVYQELDRTVDRMQQISGTQDVDVGKAPRNVSAATAIQMLVEQAQGRRFTREEELIDAFKEVYGHQLLLLSEFAREPRKYRAKNAAGKWEYRLFIGLDLAGHTDVVVEEQAGYDARAYERESVLQAIQLGVLTIGTPYSKREVMKALGIPLKVNDEENTQITQYEANWYAFRDTGQIMLPDPSADDHFLGYSIYGRFLKSPEGTEMARAAQWQQLLPLIAGWEDKLVKATAKDTQMRALLEAAAEPVTDPMSLPFQANVMLSRLQSVGFDPMSVLLPREMTERILFIWGQQGVPPQLLQHPYVTFRAVFEAHRLLGEQKKARAMQGPTFAAPAGPQTAFGTEPTAGNVPPQLGVGDQSGQPENLTNGMTG